jgi:molybdopterin converting factor small subunit
MALVFIPSLMRTVTGGKDRVEVEGRTLRQVIDALDRAYPGMKELVLAGDRPRPGVALAVNGNVTTVGLLAEVPDGAEVQILPAIGGGC